MLAVAEVHIVLLLRPRVEAEVSLVREVVRVEEQLNKASLRDEGLRLLCLPAEQTGVFTITKLSLSVAIHDLKRKQAGIVITYKTK